MLFLISTFAAYLLSFTAYIALHGYLPEVDSAYYHVVLTIIFTLSLMSCRLGTIIKILAYLTIPFFLLLLFTHFQASINGAKRWISIGGFNIQPSEFMKLCLPCAIHQLSIVNRNNYIYPLILLTVITILFQPDMGTAFFLFGLAFFVGTNGSKVILKIASILSVSFVSLILMFPYLLPYQKIRILAWLHPENSSLASLYQSQESVKIFFQDSSSEFDVCSDALFAINTDFIWTFYSCLFGEVTVFTIALLTFIFVLIIFWPIRYSLTDPRARLAAGILLSYAVACLYTLLMSMGFMPVIGLPTPLLSYGGSNFLVSTIGLTLAVKVVAEKKNLI